MIFKYLYKIFVLSYKEMMIYRLDALFGFFTTTAYSIVAVLTVFFLPIANSNLYTQFGYTKEDLLFLVLVQQSVFYIHAIGTYPNLALLSNKIHNGEIDHILIRPINYYFGLFFQKLSFLNLMMIIITFFIYYPLFIFVLNIHFSFIQWILLFFVIITSSFMIFFIKSIITLLDFFFRTNGLAEITTSFFLFDLPRYPKEIYNKNIQTFFTYFFPVLLIINPTYSLMRDELSYKIIIMIILFTILLFIINISFLKFCLKRYTSAN